MAYSPTTGRPPSILVDGLMTATTHNGVHRLLFYTLTTEIPQQSLELQIPVPVMSEIIETLTKVSR